MLDNKYKELFSNIFPDGITEDILLNNGIEAIQIIQEGIFPTRLVVKYAKKTKKKNEEKVVKIFDDYFEAKEFLETLKVSD